VALYITKHIHIQELIQINEWHSILAVQCKLTYSRLNIMVAYNPEEKTHQFSYQILKKL